MPSVTWGKRLRAKTLWIVLLALVLTVTVTAPAAQAWDPGIAGKCVWIINGPTLFSRVCVNPSDKACPVYTERWTWEGGYSKTCV